MKLHKSIHPESKRRLIRTEPGHGGGRVFSGKNARIEGVKNRGGGEI